MGHWSEQLVEGLAQRLGGSPDRRLLGELLAEAGREIDVLAGRSFHPLHRATATIDSGGLPLVDIPDMQVGSMDATAGAWEVPDPLNPQIAAILQVAAIGSPVRKAASAADALWSAGLLVVEASRAGALMGDYVLRWLGMHFDHEQRMELFRRVMDPAVRFHVPVLGVSAQGW
ncbi:MAG: hypothetical protein OXT07_10175 [bacterium]|nr:hypothetical protein [bacterium]